MKKSTQTKDSNAGADTDCAATVSGPDKKLDEYSDLNHDEILILLERASWLEPISGRLERRKEEVV